MKNGEIAGLVLGCVVGGGIVVGLAACVIIRCSNNKNDDKKNNNKPSAATAVAYMNHQQQQQEIQFQVPHPVDTNYNTPTYVSYREQSEDIVDGGQPQFRPPRIDPEERRGPGFKYNLPQRFQMYKPQDDQQQQQQQEQQQQLQIWRQPSYIPNPDRRRTSYAPSRQNSYLSDNNNRFAFSNSAFMAPSQYKRHSISVPYNIQQQHQQQQQQLQARSFQQHPGQRKEEELLYFRLTAPTDYSISPTTAVEEHNNPQHPRAWPSPLPRPHKYHTYNKEPDPAWIADNYWI